MPVPRAMSACIEYEGSKPIAVRPGPPKVCSSCWMTSLEPLAAQTLLGADRVPAGPGQVRGQLGAQLDRVPVGVAVEVAGGLARPARRSARPAARAAGRGSRWCSAVRARRAGARRTGTCRAARPGWGDRRCRSLARSGTFQSEPRLDRRAVRGQVLGLGERHHVVGDLGERVARVVDDVDAAQEGLHGQAGGVAGAAAGGQHVVGARRSSRRARPAPRGRRRSRRRCGPGRRPRRRRRSGSPGARRRTRRRPAGPPRRRRPARSPDCRPASAGAIRSSMCLVAATCGSSSFSTASASSAESVTSTAAASGSCSAWLIRSAATCTGSAVSSARIAISVGPGLGVDADPALEAAAWRRRPRCCRGR